MSPAPTWPPSRNRSTDPSRGRLGALAEKTGAAWLAGMFEVAEDASRPLNTLVLAGGDEPAAYRKIHLYDSFGYRESDTISPGALEPCVTTLDGFPLGLMTCYDLRFPELPRALAKRGAEAIVVPAAWVAGDRKVEHWRTLLRARAIENTVWVIGVGQPGPRYAGHSMVVAPDGDVVAEAEDGPDHAGRDDRPRGGRGGTPDQPVAGQPAHVSR